ncbi:MAG TPA: SDR family oxidoreductase [Myxococcota bacterium]|nr:SDR family oxidoreductase [Myxococcota bacterium]HRY92635.1 SDR family oxidoreductase [Myxococcota bacterium]
MTLDLRGKRVLVTGGARGIGLCTARELARLGAELILTDLDEAALEAARQELVQAGAKVQVRRVDVTDRAAVEQLAAWVEGELGGLDVLINNAGIGHHGELKDTSLDTWRKLLEVNLMGPLHHLHAFLPAMLERKRGSIVNVSSGQAFFRMPTWGAYAAIKAALGALSETLHYELKPHGVHVTTVYPFMTRTDFYKGVESHTLADRLSMKLLPLYSDSPEKVARKIVDAVRHKKRVEMANVLNDLGFYAQVIPFMSAIMGHTSTYLMARKG